METSVTARSGNPFRSGRKRYGHRPARDDLTELDQLVRDWRATAEELADRARRDVLHDGFDAGDFVEVARPGQGQ